MTRSHLQDTQYCEVYPVTGYVKSQLAASAIPVPLVGDQSHHRQQPHTKNALPGGSPPVRHTARRALCRRSRRLALAVSRRVTYQFGATLLRARFCARPTTAEEVTHRRSRQAVESRSTGRECHSTRACRAPIPRDRVVETISAAPLEHSTRGCAKRFRTKSSRNPWNGDHRMSRDAWNLNNTRARCRRTALEALELVHEHLCVCARNDGRTHPLSVARSKSKDKRLCSSPRAIEYSLALPRVGLNEGMQFADPSQEPRNHDFALRLADND